MTDQRRQVAFVIDLNKCMGCQTCTIACKVLKSNDKGMDQAWFMKVNTIPGRGYPRDWEQMGGGWQDGQVVLGRAPTAEEYGGIGELPFQEVFYGGKGNQAHLAPSTTPTWGPNWEEDIGGGVYPNSYYFYMPRLCNHCTKPACGQACTRHAISKNADGLVLVDEAICAGCDDQACIQACPYKEVYWNAVRTTAQKCDGCVSRLADSVAPACVRQCPGRAIWVDYLDAEDGAVRKLVAEYQVALPLHSEYGTKPNVYYVPPLAPPAIDEDGEIVDGSERIPREDLRRLFGAEVDQAIRTLQAEREKNQSTGESELMDLLIGRQWSELLGAWTRDPGEIVGISV